MVVGGWAHLWQCARLGQECCRFHLHRQGSGHCWGGLNHQVDEVEFLFHEILPGGNQAKNQSVAQFSQEISLSASITGCLFTQSYWPQLSLCSAHFWASVWQSACACLSTVCHLSSTSIYFTSTFFFLLKFVFTILLLTGRILFTADTSCELTWEPGNAGKAYKIKPQRTY